MQGRPLLDQELEDALALGPFETIELRLGTSSLLSDRSRVTGKLKAIIRVVERGKEEPSVFDGQQAPPIAACSRLKPSIWSDGPVRARVCLCRWSAVAQLRRPEYLKVRLYCLLASSIAPMDPPNIRGEQGL